MLYNLLLYTFTIMILPAFFVFNSNNQRRSVLGGILPAEAAQCSYSFVVNEIDPKSCPCYQPHISGEVGDKPSKHKRFYVEKNTESERDSDGDDEPYYFLDEDKSGLDAQDVQEDSLVSGADYPSDTHPVGTETAEETHTPGEWDRLMRDAALKEGLTNTVLEKHFSAPVTNNLNNVNLAPDELKQEFVRLLAVMKNLELKVYQESVNNRELKNIVMKQEQSVKDYSYTIDKLKNSVNRQKSHNTKTKQILLDEVTTLRGSMDIMKERLHKQDYFLRTLEKNQHAIRRKLYPGMKSPYEDRVQFVSGVKVIPVQSTSNVVCDGLSQNATKYKDCDELYQRGHRISGVYYIKPRFTPCPVPVYCDMSEDNSTGWTVIQKRTDGKLNFNRNWEEYREGFGDLNREFWLGNNNIFLLTNQASYRLRIDLWDFNNTHKYAEYHYFMLSGERDKYRLFLMNHTGSVDDGMKRHNGMMFSTKDEDNDGWENYHCGRQWGAGWWFNNCWFVTLNGRYYQTPKVRYRGISWNEWKHEQLKMVQMKISPSE